jgi:Uma2 family endonuclease
MGTVLPQNNLTTEKEFLSLPESKERLEYLDGEVILAPSPSVEHQEMVLKLSVEFSRWASAHPPAFIGLSPLDVRLGPGRIVQPDLFVLKTGRPQGGVPLSVVPELVIEVLSTNRGYDRLTKRLVYFQAGIAEYWLVDRVEQAVEQVIGLETVALCKDRVVSRVLPELEVAVPELFR